MANKVIDVLRRFLPEYCHQNKRLAPERHRAIWAILHCRSALMGGRLWECSDCGRREFRYHSCNHRNCPQCGKADTAEWVRAQLDRRVGAPYFMVTFTLPQPIRKLFFGATAKTVYDVFFGAAARALRETLANRRWLGAQTSGFSLILHTWNQRLEFHPHIHAIVPGAGIDPDGNIVSVKSHDYLVPQKALRQRFIRAFREGLQELPREARDAIPSGVWRLSWGIHLQAFGQGQSIIKYLGAYVCRTAIGDSRIVSMTDTHVTFRWKDRAHGSVEKLETIPGVEFVARYLRHVVPTGLKTIRHYGFLHPASKKKLARVAFHTGRPLFIKETDRLDPHTSFCCSKCGSTLRLVAVHRPNWAQTRAPPTSLYEEIA